ncbi:MAG: anti-sigma factor [Blastococcus sp.]
MPPTSSEHGGFDELAVGWALHALEPEDEAVFAAHLPGCARCAETVIETREAMAAMATDLPSAEPSEELRHSLRAAVADTEQVRRPVSHVPSPAADPDGGRPDGAGDVGPVRRFGAGPEQPAWRRFLPAALVAAAFATIVGLGLWSVFLTSERNDAVATAAEQAAIVEALLEPGQAAIAPVADAEGRTVATVVARDDRMQVVADGLSTNDTSSSIYVVWGMREGVPNPIGTFDVVNDRMDLRTVGSDQTGLDDYRQFAISIEPGRQAPSVPTEVVASGEVTS